MFRKVFTKEFKIAAVKLVFEDEIDIREVARQLGIHSNGLWRGVQKEWECFPRKGCDIYDCLVLSAWWHVWNSQNIACISWWGVEINHKQCGRILMLKVQEERTENTMRWLTTKSVLIFWISFSNQKEETKIWVGDMIFISTKEGFQYPAVLMDVFSRKVVGWSMGKRMSGNLVMDAWTKAYGRQHPQKGFIVHSDQGSMYTSLLSWRWHLPLVANTQTVIMAILTALQWWNPFTELWKENKLTGKLLDDEGSREECIQVHRTVLNTQRKHSGLVYMSPREFGMRNT